MIIYNIGGVECKIGFEDFLSLVYIDKKLYKSDFKSVSEYYEFIDKNIKDISELVFDNYSYKLNDGLLHNLYGPAIIKVNPPESFMGRTISKRFYIKGKLVSIRQGNPCKNLKEFEEDKIYYYEFFSKNKNRLKEGIDYKRYPYNLELLRKHENRRKKLNKLNKKN